MTFRTRATDENARHRDRALPDGPDRPMALQRCLNLKGVGLDNPYVLQLSYDTALFGGADQQQTQIGRLWLGEYTPGGQWAIAAANNLEATGRLAQIGVYESYSDFMAGLPGGTTVAQVLGSYGIDPPATLGP